jgi:hypothetical protein
MNFDIGTTIDVTTRTKSNLLGKDYDIRKYSGKVVENFKWLGPEYVCIATGNPNWPVSAIMKSTIEGFKKSKVASTTRIFKVTSKQSKKTYRVIFSGGVASCDCLGYQFRQGCKHSKKVLDKVSGRC